MALNFSQSLIFPSHLSEDNFVSPTRVANGYLEEGILENRDDIVDRLPSDPFDMEITTTFTAITSWLEDLEVDYGGYGRTAVGNSANLNFILTNILMLQSSPRDTQLNHIVSDSSASDGWANKIELNHAEEIQEEGIESVRVQHQALLFSLRFLGVRDLLSVERVCRSLRSSVQTDLLLWRKIFIDQPLNEKITDDILLKLTSRAQGTLRSLSLVDCLRITDDGVERVLKANLQLRRLSVPGCTRLSIDGIVNTLKTLKSEGTLSIKHLRIRGLSGMTEEHFKDLKLLLGSHRVQNDHKPPRYYNMGHHYYLLRDDDNAIDIEACPKCQNLKLVYDCPAKGCQEGQDYSCRGCILCIPRCVECGCCINGSEYEETFCLECRCSNCSKRPET